MGFGEYRGVTGERRWAAGRRAPRSFSARTLLRRIAGPTTATVRDGTPSHRSAARRRQARQAHRRIVRRRRGPSPARPRGRARLRVCRLRGTRPRVIPKSSSPGSRNARQQANNSRKSPSPTRPRNSTFRAAPARKDAVFRTVAGDTEPAAIARELSYRCIDSLVRDQFGDDEEVVFGRFPIEGIDVHGRMGYLGFAPVRLPDSQRVFSLFATK